MTLARRFLPLFAGLFAVSLAAPALAEFREFTGTLEITKSSDYLNGNRWMPAISVGGSGVAWSQRSGTNAVGSFGGVTGFTGTTTVIHPPPTGTTIVQIEGLGANPIFTAASSGSALHGPAAVPGRKKTGTVAPGTPSFTYGSAGVGLGGTVLVPAFGWTLGFATWTTGSVTVTGVQSENGGLPGGTITAMGTDQRTANGAGTVQLVTPTRVDSSDSSVAWITRLTLNFAPEPGRGALLGSGALVLALLGRRRMR